jgi:GntR family transcriptional regulator/MocR family aminotransferase
VLSFQQESLLSPVAPDGLYALRVAIAQNLYSFRSLRVDPDQILIGAGSEYLLGLLVQLLGRTRCCAVEDPGYRKTQSILESNGMKTIPIPMDADGLSAKALSESPADVVHVTPSHHFPLGIVMPVSRRNALLQWASEAPDRYVIEDEYDSEIRFTGKPIPTLRSLDHGDRVIYMNTFAKTLSPSLRISYLVLPKQLRARFQQQLAFYANTVPSFEQYTLARFLSEGYFERHLNRTKKHYRKRRDCLIRVIRSHALSPFLQIVGAEAGMHFLLHVHLPLAEETLIALAKQAGISVTGLSAYYAEGKKPPQSHPVLILGYACLPEETLVQGMQTMLDVWQHHLEAHAPATDEAATCAMQMHPPCHWQHF